MDRGPVQDRSRELGQDRFPIRQLQNSFLRCITKQQAGQQQSAHMAANRQGLD